VKGRRRKRSPKLLVTLAKGGQGKNKKTEKQNNSEGPFF
jgi:hypothetical protein